MRARASPGACKALGGIRQLCERQKLALGCGVIEGDTWVSSGVPRQGVEVEVGLPVVAWGSGIPLKGQEGEQSQGWAGQGEQSPVGLGRAGRGFSWAGDRGRCGRDRQDLAAGAWRAWAVGELG